MAALEELMRERARAVAEMLSGSPAELSAHATEDEINNVTFCQELDEHVFQCSTCGWWCEPDELILNGGDEQTCMDCDDGCPND